MVEESGFGKLFKSFTEIIKTPILDTTEQARSDSPPIFVDEEAVKNEIKEIISKESGWDRIKAHFSYELVLFFKFKLYALFLILKISIQ